MSSFTGALTGGFIKSKGKTQIWDAISTGGVSITTGKIGDKIFGKTPKPAPLPPIPTEYTPEAQNATRQQRLLSQIRGGRRSTILTDATQDAAGGKTLLGA